MAINITCSCGNRIRAQTDFAEFLCPVCGHLFQNSTSPSPTNDECRTSRSSQDSGFVVYGLDPPAPPPIDELSYRVLTVAEENPPPPPSQAPAHLWPAVEEADPRLANLYPPLDEKKLDVRRFLKIPPLEKYWPESLAYPFQAWTLLLGLAFGLTILTASAIGFLQLRPVNLGQFLLNPVSWFLGGLSVVAFAYTAGLFVCVFRSGAAGEIPNVRWPAGDVVLAAKSLGFAISSFLAGPILPAFVALYFWINSGFLELIDQVILFELGLATVGYWLLVFLSITQAGGLKGARPEAIVRLATRLGVWGFIGPAVAYAFLLLHAPWALFAIQSGHHTAVGWILLFLCWSSLLFGLTFLFRWLGVCMFRGKSAKKAKGLQPAT